MHSESNLRSLIRKKSRRFDFLKIYVHYSRAQPPTSSPDQVGAFAALQKPRCTSRTKGAEFRPFLPALFPSGSPGPKGLTRKRPQLLSRLQSSESHNQNLEQVGKVNLRSLMPGGSFWSLAPLSSEGRKPGFQGRRRARPSVSCRRPRPHPVCTGLPTLEQRGQLLSSNPRPGKWRALPEEPGLAERCGEHGLQSHPVMSKVPCSSKLSS